MEKENLKPLQNLYDIQSLSKYSLVDKELSYEKYYRVIDFQIFLTNMNLMRLYDNTNFC